MKNRYEINVLKLFIKSKFFILLIFYLACSLYISSYNFQSFPVNNFYELVIYIITNQQYMLFLFTPVFFVIPNNIDAQYYKNYNVLFHFQSKKKYLNSIAKATLYVSLIVMVVNILLYIVFGLINQMSIFIYIFNHDFKSILMLFLLLLTFSIVMCTCSLLFLLLRKFFNSIVAIILQLTIIFVALISQIEFFSLLRHINPITDFLYFVMKDLTISGYVVRIIFYCIIFNAYFILFQLLPTKKAVGNLTK